MAGDLTWDPGRSRKQMSRRRPLFSNRRRTTPLRAGRGGIARDTRTILFGGARRYHLVARAWTARALAAAASGAAVAIAEARTAQDSAPTPAATEEPATEPPAFELPPIAWRNSRSLGKPWAGRLRGGVLLPAESPIWFTWDPVLKSKPNRSWRRWGSDDLLATLIDVLTDFAEAHPDRPRVGIGDLSRPKGGEFGNRFGGLGHMSHQNGLDADVYYPRWDGLELRPYSPDLVDRALAQELVDLFVEAGAEKVYVGPRLRLKGPRKVVIPLVHHDDHLHVRIRPSDD